MMYKVGDTVVIRRDLVAGERYGNVSFVEPMEKHRGKTTAIANDNVYDGYTLADYYWVWTDEMIDHNKTEQLNKQTKLDKMCDFFSLSCAGCPLASEDECCLGRGHDENIVKKVNEWTEKKGDVKNKLPTQTQTPTPTKVTQKQVDELFEASKKNIQVLFEKTLMMSVQLPNGFVITETASAVDPNNFSSSVGIEICEGKIKNKLWELEGYVLHINKGV